LSAISALIDEGTFVVDEEGIRLRSMDPSRVAMVDFMWNKSVFDEFECAEETRICVSVKELLKLMGKAKRGEAIELEFEKESGKLKASIIGRYKRSFLLPILEAGEEEFTGEIKIPFTAKVTMSSDELKSAIAEAKMVSDRIRMVADTDKFTLVAKGDVNEIVIEFPRDCEAIIDMEVSEETKATFGLSYLEDIVKRGSSLSDVVSVEYATDKPIRLDFKLPYEGRLVYYLAPIMEE
jgi:proliferating cell nuclear antigen